MTYIFNPLNGNLEFNSVPNNSITTEKLAKPINPIVQSINDGPLSGQRNRIINGDFRLDQNNAGAVINNALGYTVDRWRLSRVGAGQFSVQRSTVAPPDFSNSLALTVTTSTTPSANNSYSLNQIVEGINATDFSFGTASAKTVQLSFWVRSSLPGNLTYSVALQDFLNTRSYVATYSINNTNTWEYKSITIPGATTGTWNSDGWGFVIFDLGSGSSANTTAGAWQNGSFTRTLDCVNVVSNSGAVLNVTGVQLELGSQPTPFERRFYSQELLFCQRYYNQFYVYLDSEHAQVGQAITYPVEMRVPPTITPINLEQLNCTVQFSLVLNGVTYGGTKGTTVQINRTNVGRQYLLGLYKATAELT